MKKTIVLASAAALLAGCATKNINSVDAQKPEVKTVEQRVISQEATINKLNDQMELMGKNLIFLNKKVKSQEEMLNATQVPQTTDVVSQEVVSGSLAMISGNLTKFAPSTFTIIATTPVYNNNGDEITTWNAGKRFTSYLKDGNFYKVSGYSAAGKRWAKTNQELYIPMENTQQAR